MISTPTRTRMGVLFIRYETKNAVIIAVTYSFVFSFAN